MNQPVFDAKNFFTFDLTQGEIHDMGGERMAVLPMTLLASIEPTEQVYSIARNWGRTHGRKLHNQIVASQVLAKIDLLANHLGGAAAVFGLGSLSLEIRGAALLFRLESPEKTPLSPGLTTFLGAFLSGYLTALTSHRFEVLSLLDSGHTRIYFAGCPEATDRVNHWMTQGTDPLAAVDKLETGNA